MRAISSTPLVHTPLIHTPLIHTPLIHTPSDHGGLIALKLGIAITLRVRQGRLRCVIFGLQYEKPNRVPRDRRTHTHTHTHTHTPCAHTRTTGAARQQDMRNPHTHAQQVSKMTYHTHSPPTHTCPLPQISAYKRSARQQGVGKMQHRRYEILGKIRKGSGPV